MKILVTGAAGFIGYHIARVLCQRGDEVVGIDNLNDYYDVGLKQARLTQLDSVPGFEFIKMDIAHRPVIEKLFVEQKFDRVVNMAAQAHSFSMVGQSVSRVSARLRLLLRPADARVPGVRGGDRLRDPDRRQDQCGRVAG